MLAEMYNKDTDPTGYFISEKLDGVWCIWTGEKMISRNGKEFNPPDYFTESFPRGCMLDGELFFKRGEFSKTISIVWRKVAHDGWKNIVFLVFDAPYLKGDFWTRLTKLKKMF